MDTNKIISSQKRGPNKREKHLDKTYKLNLRGNRLTKIGSNLFEKSKKLKKLHLDGNEIREIESNGFRCLDNLEELD
jgi:Leucine-rich repeat (LRR) protein